MGLGPGTMTFIKRLPPLCQCTLKERLLEPKTLKENVKVLIGTSPVNIALSYQQL